VLRIRAAVTEAVGANVVGNAVTSVVPQARAQIEKAPEVLTTPCASFLGSGGGIREQPSAAKASRRVVSLATPDLRVMSADWEVGVSLMFL